MKKRVIAAVLVLILLVTMLCGCGKNQQAESSSTPSVSDSKNNHAESARGKYAYQASYIPLDCGEDYQLEYINNFCISDNAIYFYGDCIIGEEPWVDVVTGETMIDEITGEPYMNPIYETCLFRMDLSTQQVTQVNGYQPHELPEGQMGGSYISGIQPGVDGSLWLFEQFSTYYFDLPEDFDAETGSPYDYYTQGENKIRLHQLDAAGEWMQTVELEVPQDTYLDSILVMENGKIFCTNWMNILSYDLSGQQTGSVAVPEECSINTLLDRDGALYAWIWKEGSSYLISVDMETLAFGEEVKLVSNAYNLYAGNESFDYIYDYNGTFFGHSKKTGESEKLFSWIDCDVDDTNFYSVAKLTEDGCVFTLERIYDQGSENTQYNLVVMEQVDPETLPVKQELILACFYLDWDLRSDIVAFNKSHDDVRIVVKEYSQYATEENTLAGLQKLNTEIMSGMVPDLFLINTEIPVEQYAAQGILMDLWPLIDSDSELSRDDLMTHFFDALSIDGKLYQIVDSFAITTVAGKTSVVGNGESWTMDDLMTALKQQPEGTTIFSNYDTKDAILTNCISRNAESFIDWNTLQCSFDSQEFIDLLTFANQFPEEIDYDKLYADNRMLDVESEAAMLRSGKQMLYRVDLYSFQALQWANAVFGEEVNFIGYPTTMNNGSCFQIYSGLAISASCANVEAAWSFIRTYLTEEHQTQEYMYQFPTNRHSFEALAERSMTTEYQVDPETGEEIPVPNTSIWYGMEDELLIYAMTQEELDLFMDIYENCSNFYSYNQEITQLISEEAEVFFQGQKTAEETARLIQDRVGLYVMENG